MGNDPKSTVSRRAFLGIAAFGACTSFCAGDTTRPATSDDRLRAEPVDTRVRSTSASQSRTKAYQTLSLDGGWSITALPLELEGDSGYRAFKRSGKEPTPAQVPGEVHLDLMRAGRMEDPNIGDNARSRCRWPEKHSWWYRKEFVIPDGFLSSLQQRLIFEGIDLYGQVFLNGVLAGITQDALAAVEFDVRHLLTEGTNELVVRVTSGMELPAQAAAAPTAADLASYKSLNAIYAVRALEAFQGSQRKPRCAYGTDYCDPLPNIGIWRPVRLEGRTKVVIHHLRLDTVIRGQEVSLEGEIAVENLHPWSEIPATLELLLEPPQGDPLVQRLTLSGQVGRSSVPCRLVVERPQLWWPNGMGAQPLYKLTACVLCGDEETDRQVQTIGLRTVELDCSPLPQGRRFGFKVNGQRVFCKGGNWVQTDLIPARTDATQYAQLVTEARTANFNMLRVNGDSFYEADCFYEACDRAGILVWQEFSFSETRYRDWDPRFLELVRAEAESTVKRLRHHPSVALWCGNNECQWGMDRFWKVNLTDPKELGGTKVYNEILPDICHFYDPVRPYWPGSPSGGTDPNNELAGDFHGLGNNPDHAMTHDGWREIADRSRARFVSESYVIGPPSLASVREYLRPDELYVQSTGWRIHTNEREEDTTAEGIRYHYGETRGLTLQQFILYGQMYQALVDANIMESLRFRKDDSVNDCQGHLVWSYNDTWGEVGWSIIDHYLRRKASYYWLKRAATPVKVLVRSRDNTLVTRVVNDTLRPYRAEVRYGWMRVDGARDEMQSRVIDIPSNEMIEVGSVTLPSSTERDPRKWLYAAILTGIGLPTDQALWPLVPHRELALQSPSISVKVANRMLVISSPVYCHGVHLEDDGHETLADNYFDLLPGVSRYIPITQARPSNSYPLSAVMPISFQTDIERSRT